MMNLCDIHCHILPYVDDGAAVMEESLTLAKMQYDQGIREICCTPHLRKGMFETSDTEIIRRFYQLEEVLKENLPEMELYLSREYHCDSLFREHLESGNILPLGEGTHLLIEFSSRHSLKAMESYIDLCLSHGYTPLIAHVERYPAAEGKDNIKKLIQRGALIQINASSVLGREGLKKKWLVQGYLKDHLVHVVASDCHDSEERPPEIQQAFDKIQKKFGEALAKEVLAKNPAYILHT